jgi:hypothetical protein
MLKEFDVACVSVPDAAVSVYVPTLTTCRSVNVATPLTAATVAVPYNVWLEIVSVTDAELVVTVLPDSSLISTVTGMMAPATALAGCVPNVRCVAAHAVNVTVASSVIDEPPSVPVTVAVPAVVPEDNTAVYVPFVLSVTLPSEPSVVASATVPPLAVRLLPY